MKKYVIGICALATLFGACKDKDKDPVPNPPVNSQDSVLNGNITANRTLKAGSTYIMDGVVYVKDGATLTIEPGVTIKAKKGKTALIVTRGSKINAVGTADKPIVFTSAEGMPAYGDWGGLVILGRATTNASFNGQPGVGEIEGGVNNAQGDGLYGGSDDMDNSGKLSFVRIEWAGYPFMPDKELNSLTLGGVGAGTQIDHVQVSYAYDDAFEMFGGTVNLKYIIAYKTYDDDFDCDAGYRGKVQFAIAYRDGSVADISGANGFEQDNDGSGTTTTPITAPVFSNVTLIGPRKDAQTAFHANYKRAAHLRRNTRTSIFNSVLMGYPTGILLDGSKSAQNLMNGDMELKGVIVAGAAKPLDTTGTTSAGLNLVQMFNSNGWNNEVLGQTADVMLANAYGAGDAFDPAPMAGSPLLGNASFNSAKLSGMSPVSYRGAVSGPNDNWWKGWTKW